MIKGLSDDEWLENPEVLREIDRHIAEHHARVLEIYTDGICEDDTQVGCGIWYGQDDPRNDSIRVKKPSKQTDERAKLMAILIAIQQNPPQHDDLWKHEIAKRRNVIVLYAPSHPGATELAKLALK
jgi:hypothetical protein